MEETLGYLEPTIEPAVARDARDSGALNAPQGVQSRLLCGRKMAEKVVDLEGPNMSRLD